MNTNIDNLYWLFSAAAQSIAAFVAFLLTGYALVHSIMDSLRQTDTSLSEIHDELKRIYHLQLTILSICTASAVLLSLLCVYLNPLSFYLKTPLFILTAVIDAIAVLGGVLFVVSIINPDKYRKTAKHLLEEERKHFTPSGREVNVGEFMTAFISLEKSIREFIMQHQLLRTVENRSMTLLSFPEMVNILSRAELIDRNFMLELMDISKYRNLIVHGRVEDVDETMVYRVKNIEQQWNNISSKVQNKHIDSDKD